MPKPKHPPSPSAPPKPNPPTQARRPLAARRLGGSLILAVLALATAAGCGETANNTPAANNPQTTPTPTAATATTSQNSTPRKNPSQPHSTPASAQHGRSALAKARVHAAFSSLAHAKPARKLTPEQRSKLAVADIELSSPAIHSLAGATSQLSRQYTCDGADHSPPLHWGTMPAGTVEIAILAISTNPVKGKLFYDWALAGINPKLTGLAAGQQPTGTIPGRNSYGHNTYTICPNPGNPETYVFAIYALPQHLTPHPGFNPATLRTQALHTAHHSGLLVSSYQHT